MRRIKMLLIGLFPFIFGYAYICLHLAFIFNHYSSLYYYTSTFIGVVFLIIWFFISIITVKLTRSKIEAVILLNAPTFLVLIYHLFLVFILESTSLILTVPSFTFYFMFERMMNYFISWLYGEYHVYLALLYVIPFISMLIVTYLGRVVIELARDAEALDAENG